MFGFPDTPALQPDRWLDDGDTVTVGDEVLEVVHTPGHTPGHVCLAAGDVLLCADHVLPVTVPQQWPESIAAYTGLGHYLQSLDKLGSIAGFRLALGGHQAPFEHLYHRIEQIRDIHLRRLDRVQEIVRRAAEPMTIVEIAARLYTQAQGLHAVMSVMDTGARVEYLHEHGQLAVANLEQVQRGEAWRWEAGSD
jgi:glyoxylase-like metal-dependent hydrolase (beta-lactamase superfamily II)